MSKQKSYNSIFFITTLSVYLGLVLVGASPSVLAQQAVFTGKFEVQNEIEIRDDLDKNPDEDKSLENFLLVRLDEALNSFVNDLRDLNRRGKYKLKPNEIVSAGCGHYLCANDVGDTIQIEDSELFEELNKLRRKLDIFNGRRTDNLPEFIELIPNEIGNCKTFSLETSLDKSEFKVEISFSQNLQNASVTAENLNTLFSTKAVNSQNTATKLFYENTKAKADNQYVKVVTRLPRGSLNTLVKSRG